MTRSCLEGCDANPEVPEVETPPGKTSTTVGVFTKEVETPEGTTSVPYVKIGTNGVTYDYESPPSSFEVFVEKDPVSGITVPTTTTAVMIDVNGNGLTDLVTTDMDVTTKVTAAAHAAWRGSEHLPIRTRVDFRPPTAARARPASSS